MSYKVPEHAFQPVEIGEKTISSRIVHLSLDRRRAPRGVISSLARDFYSERIEEAGSLIITEPISITARGPWQFAAQLTNDEQKEAWKQVFDAIHSKNGVVFANLYHPGKNTTPGLIRRSITLDEYQRNGDQPVGVTDYVADPEAVKLHPVTFERILPPRPLTTVQVKEIEEQFLRTALEAIDAGADGIVINAADEFLVEQFLRESQFRTDEYKDGHLFLLNLVKKIAAAIGSGKIGIILPENYDEILQLVEKLSSINVAFIGLAGEDLKKIPSRKGTVFFQITKEGTILVDDGDGFTFSQEYAANVDLIRKLKDGAVLAKFDKTYLHNHSHVGYTSVKQPLVSAQNLPRKRVAIIGAGVSGISSASAFQRVGNYDIVVFERKSTPGGTWNYDSYRETNPSLLAEPDTSLVDPAIEPPQSQGTYERSTTKRYLTSPVYPELVTNVPQRIMFGHHTFKKDIAENDPVYISGKEVQDHLRKVSERFHSLIRFNTAVEKVERTTSGKFRVHSRQFLDGNKESWTDEEFDNIIVANGHNSVPRIPKLPGSDVFKGQISHTYYYKGPEVFKNKRLLVVGSRESGLDIMRQAIIKGVDAYISQRSPHPIFPEAVSQFGERVFPATVGFTEDKVLFEDGTEHKFDVVVFATGYHYSYPFLRSLPRINPATGQTVPYSSDYGHFVPGLYYHIFDTYQSGLAIIGNAVGTPTYTAWEKAAFVAALLFNGLAELPSVREQEEWVEKQLIHRKGPAVFHLLDPSTRAAHFEDLNLVAAKFLESPLVKEEDDALLRDWSLYWNSVFFEALAVKKKQYQLPVAVPSPRASQPNL